MKINQIIPTLLIVLFVIFSHESKSQGFLHANGKNIVNGDGENVILRGIGTGNWMLMEGYMMKTEGVAGTQHEFRAKLEELIGVEKTNQFFDTWLNNHFTRADVDSMKAWGFNSVRVAMHYNLFTLPIEKEPIPGNNTWLLKGFKMIDNLLDWCEANEMYLILDLHGAPGGQGSNADISDYNPSKPSLWESQSNKNKTVALWKQLAQRYSNEPWIGGYDLVNETNWTFPEGNNSQMRELFGQITDAIREVDQNHIIFIEGNSFANDHSGLTPPWDDNMVYSFHKYWSGTSSTDLDWIIKLRDEHNVPLWLGESGENSNTWFTDLIALSEENNIGWSWWPVKKNGINNVLNVTLNKDYENLVKYWKGEIPTAPSPTEAFNAVMQWAENHKIENCKVQYDVIDAMIRQPHTDETKPFAENKLNEPVFFSDFDLGKIGFAYYDKDAAYYGGNWTDWNTGWSFRNDGVDIEVCNDAGDVSNGYSVGWTDNDEWMQYTFQSDSTAIYKLSIRHASGYSGSKFHIEVNGADVTGKLSLQGTGGWQNWQSAAFENIVIPAGKIKIRYVNDQGGSNLSYFKFSEPQSATTVAFKASSAKTSDDGYEIYLSLNKEITGLNEELNVADFTLKVDGNPVDLLTIKKDTEVSNVLILRHDTDIFSDNQVTITYNGNSVKSGNQNLDAFTDLPVENQLPTTHPIPGLIQAEDFYFNNGLSLEDCSDLNGGKNTSYAAPGEYLEYLVSADRTGIYQLTYRVATEHSDAEIVLLVGDGQNYTAIDTFAFTNTGGWQTWQDQSTSVRMEKGYHFIRLLVKQGEQNLNWFKFDLLTSSKTMNGETKIRVFPNPVSTTLNVVNPESDKFELTIFDLSGRVVARSRVEKSIAMDVSSFVKGTYLVWFNNGKKSFSEKIIVQ